MSTAKSAQPQQHLLPKQNIKNGSINNTLDAKKMKYIIEMRKSLCNENIMQKDGSLNLKYFNVKKGHYWSQNETKMLIEAVLAHGPANVRKIKKDKFSNWTETEIRLRICRLLKYYNLSDYEGRMFASKEELLAEAKKNKQEAERTNQKVGGILYNPPQSDQSEFFGSKSRASAQ